MDDLKTNTLPRDMIGEFIKSPRGIRSYEELQGDTINIYQAIASTSFLTVVEEETLGSERTLTLTTDLTGVDGGANGPYTLGLADTAVVAGVYGSATNIPSITVDVKGRIIAAEEFELNSDNVTEGTTNLYFTQARARAAISASSPLGYDTATGVLSFNGVLALANGGTGAASAAAARTNLGLVIGTDVQAFNSNLSLYAGGSTPSAFTLGLASNANAAAWRTALGVGTGTGSVTSVDVSGGTTGLTTSGGPITGSGTITLAGTLAIANGGTGATNDVNARISLGAAASGPITGSGVSLSTGRLAGRTTAGTGAVEEISAGTGLSLSAGTLAVSLIPIANGGTGAVTAGAARTALGLAIGTDVQAFNANLSAYAGGSTPSAFTLGIVNSASAAAFRAAIGAGTSSATGTVTSIDASGGTTGLTFSGGPVTASGTLTLGGTLALANGGTGATTAVAARTNLGATTAGSNFFTLANPSAITFPRINADNSVSALTDVAFRIAISAPAVGAITSSGLTATSARILGRTTAGTGAIEELDATASRTFLNVANGATANSTDAFLLSRANHTGTQAPATIQSAAASVLFGRYAATAGIGQEITIGANLSLNSTTGVLSASAPGTGTVTSVAVSGGTTGLTTSGGPISTSGTITLAGTLGVANGGTGAATLTGYVKGAGSSALTASATIPGSDISGNISGNSANVTGTVAIANGGTGATTAANARTALGATTVGGNLFTLANPSAVAFARFNADNSVSALDDVTFRVAIGAPAVGAITGSGLTMTTARMLGRITAATGALEEMDATAVRSFINVASGATNNPSTTVGANLLNLTNPSAIRFLRINADNSVSALDDVTFRVAISAPASGAITGSGLTISSGRLAGRTTAATGAIEEISAGTGLNLASGTIALANTAVAPATYGSATAIPMITIDQQGRVTTATTAAVTASSVDVSGASISLANGATVDFVNFSGTITVNDYTTGGVGFYLVGGNAVLSLGSTQTIGGTLVYNGALPGYRFTNTSGATRTLAFATVKTRAFP